MANRKWFMANRESKSVNIKVYNQTGEEVGEMELPKVFATPMNRDMLHQVVEAQGTNLRPTIASTKDRAQVRGGGKKPWRQKGTGRARHGSIRSPIWRGGGITHGPRKEKNFLKKINRKMASAALAMALSAKAKDNEIVLLDVISLPEGKTKSAALIFKNLSGNKPLSGLLSKNSVVLMPADAKQELRAFRNLANVDVKPAIAVTAREVLANSFVLMPKASIAILEGRLAKK